MRMVRTGDHPARYEKYDLNGKDFFEIGGGGGDFGEILGDFGSDSEMVREKN
jgi:hypothetical protein